jgi:uncharacterized protein (DUF1684 family)
MKYLKTQLIIFSLLLTSFACSYKTNESYLKEIQAWREARIERLKSKTGWLNLAGLFWLKEGENTFGSDSSNIIIFPPNALAFYGSIQKTGDSIVLKAAKRTGITVDGEIAAEKLLTSDAAGKPSLMESGSLAWIIIKRDDRYGIRLRDYNHPRITKLENIPCYETSPEWKITADFIPFDSIQSIETATVIGTTEINNCPGELVFRIGFTSYHLLPFSEGNEFFIIFADKTNGIETYGNGRFLYTSIPDSQNKVILDFNKAYNPPCAFSPFATCPMPPRENFLDLKIEAGEKEVHFAE